MTSFSSGEKGAFSEHPHFEDNFSHEISSAALVRLLIRKGITTPSEVLEEEHLYRLERQAPNSYSLQKKLKRWAGKRRWSRKLTHLLFGWKWRRSRHEYHSAAYPEG